MREQKEKLEAELDSLEEARATALAKAAELTEKMAGTDAEIDGLKQKQQKALDEAAALGRQLHELRAEGMIKMTTQWLARFGFTVASRCLQRWREAARMDAARDDLTRQMMEQFGDTNKAELDRIRAESQDALMALREGTHPYAFPFPLI